MCVAVGLSATRKALPRQSACLGLIYDKRPQSVFFAAAVCLVLPGDGRRWALTTCPEQRQVAFVMCTRVEGFGGGHVCFFE